VLWARKENPVRRAILSLTLLALPLAGASPAGAGGLDLRIGAYFPRGNETLFQDVRDLYFVEKSDFYGVYGGIEYNQKIVDNVELGVHFDGYSRSVDTSYRDYTRPSGDEIRQTLKLWQAPLGVSVRLVPTSKRTKVAPFVGAGVDAIFYHYEEYGDFIDFFDPTLPIVADAFVADGTAFGFHVLGGFRWYLNRDFAIVAEGRYQWATDKMGDDFGPTASGFVYTLDLSGATATVGLHVRF
jgi:hypothetical protein